MANTMSNAPARQSKYNSQLIAALFYVLRNRNIETAANAPMLAEEISDYLGPVSKRTIQRTIAELLDYQNYDREEDPKARTEKKKIAEVLYSVYGGRIGTVGEKHLRYFFEPCLDDASMRMLKGTVLSNRFLSQDEKDYLLSRMRIMNMLEDTNPEASELEEEDPDEGVPEAEDLNTASIPGEDNLFLRNIVQLNRAITEEKMIVFTYGTYDKAANGTIDYHARMEGNKKKRYVVNPYAMFWNNGHYYLLATYVEGKEPSYMKGEKQTVHFRVDRIIRLKVLEKHRRERIPQDLKREYFEVDVFLEEKYTRRFPHMRISREARLINCVIECTPWSLQVLVDAFGTMFQVKESRKKHGEDELDYNAREQVFLEAYIKDVDFENARDFCLANPEYLTPIEPAELVDAVKEKLEYSLNKYQANLRR